MTWMMSEPGDQVLAAFHAALGNVQQVLKTREADTGKYTYTYADLADVLIEVKRVCHDQDLRLVQVAHTHDDSVLVTNTLLHVSGQWITFEGLGMKVPAAAQALGSAVTYMRRYSLLSLFAMPVEDDDGSAATRTAEALVQSGYRTQAESRIHELFAEMPVDVGRAVRAKFRQSFGMGLSDLPPQRHGDALTFVIEQTPLVTAEVEQLASEQAAEQTADPAPDPATPNQEE